MSTTVGSVYVHAPFCARRCAYCDFAVSVRRVGDVDGWIAAVGAELAWQEAEGTFHLADTIDTLYVGGGTPSLLGAEAMARLRHVLGPGRVEPGRAEWTVDRPGIGMDSRAHYGNVLFSLGPDIEDRLKSVGIAPTERAEQVPIEAFCALARTLED